MYDIFTKCNGDPGADGGKEKTTERPTGKGGREKANSLGRAVGARRCNWTRCFVARFFSPGPEAGN